MAEAPLAPEVLALLEELAGDPRASLLRVESHRALRAALHREPPAGLSAPGLTSLERHLLRTHRAELAFALRQACVMKIHSSRSTWYRPVEWYRADKKIDIPTWDRWTARSEELSSVATDDSEARLGLDLLQQCVGPESFAETSISQLAAASMRLEPTDQARVYVGQDLMLRDLIPDATVALSQVTRHSQSAVAAHAWANLGLIEATNDHMEAAIGAYNSALRLDPDLLYANVGLLSCCVFSMDKPGATTAAGKLDATCPSSGALDSVAAALQEQAPEELETVARGRSRFARSLLSSVGLASGKVLSVYA